MKSEHSEPCQPLGLTRLGAVLLVVVSGHSAWAQSTTYFDPGALVAASEALPGIRQSIYQFPSAGGPSLTISNVTFEGRYLITDGTGLYLYNFDGGGPLTIRFDTGVRAFGAEFSSLLSPWASEFTASVSLDTGESFSFEAPAGPPGKFFGFISPTPIKEIVFSDGGSFPGGLHEELIGNVFMVVEIPEPSSLALYGAGGLLLLAYRTSRLDFRSSVEPPTARTTL